MRFSVLLLVILGILTVPVARCLYAGSDVVEVRRAAPALLTATDQLDAALREPVVVAHIDGPDAE